MKDFQRERGGEATETCHGAAAVAGSFSSFTVMWGRGKVKEQ